MLLASCGCDVRFHTWPEGEYRGCFQQAENTNGYNSVSWCKEGDFLVVVPQTGKTAVLKVEQGVSLFQTIDVEHVFSAAYSKSQQNIISLGTEYGKILTYDVNTKEISCSFSDLPSPVRFLHYGIEDGTLAAGCENGLIYVFGSSNAVKASFVVPNNQNVSAMKFHPSDPNILGGASTGGVVVVWDSLTSDTKFTKKEHDNTITDFSFSPKGWGMISVGLDNKFFGYDIRENTCMFTSVLDYQLTAVGFSQTGEQFVVASNNGKLICFDVRNIKIPLSTVTAHNSPITKIEFQSVIIPDEISAEVPPSDAVSKQSSTKPTNTKSVTTDNESKLTPDDSFAISSYMNSFDFEECQNSTINVDPMKLWMNQFSSTASLNKLAEKFMDELSIENYPTDLLQFRDEVLMETRKFVDFFTESINNEFLMIRMKVSKDFVGIETKLNTKWNIVKRVLKKIVIHGNSKHLVFNSDVTLSDMKKTSDLRSTAYSKRV